MRFREIGVEPDFDYTLFIDTDKILRDLKMAEFTIQNREASESPDKDIQVFGVGYMLDLGDAQWKMINIDVQIDQQGTQMLNFLLVEITDMYELIDGIPEIENMNKLLVIIGIGKY